MSHRHRHRTATAAGGVAALALAALALLAGCSGSGSVPDLVSAGSLAPGACQQAATPINTVHRQVMGLKSDRGKAAAARTSLARVTTDLQALGAPGGQVSDRTGALVQAVGFLRVGIDTHSYDNALLARTDDAARSLAKACRKA